MSRRLCRTGWKFANFLQGFRCITEKLGTRGRLLVRSLCCCCRRCCCRRRLTTLQEGSAPCQGSGGKHTPPIHNCSPCQGNSRALPYTHAHWVGHGAGSTQHPSSRTAQQPPRRAPGRKRRGVSEWLQDTAQLHSPPATGTGLPSDPPKCLQTQIKRRGGGAVNASHPPYSLPCDLPIGPSNLAAAVENQPLQTRTLPSRLARQVQRKWLNAKAPEVAAPYF